MINIVIIPKEIIKGKQSFNYKQAIIIQKEEEIVKLLEIITPKIIILKYLKINIMMLIPFRSASKSKEIYKTVEINK